MNEWHVCKGVFGVFSNLAYENVTLKKIFVLQTLPYYQVLDVVGTHPPACRKGSERRVQTVHVKQERAIVALDQWSQSAAPERKRQLLMYNILKRGLVKKITVK